MPPFHNLSALDTVQSNSQTVPVPSGGGIYQSFNALAVGLGDVRVSNVTFAFEDGTSEDTAIIVAPWYSGGSIFNGPISTYAYLVHSMIFMLNEHFTDLFTMRTRRTTMV